MRFHPSLAPLAFAVALMAFGPSALAATSEDADASSDEAQGNAQNGSQALDDEALQDKYGITPGALKREKPASDDESGDEGQAPSDDGKASEPDASQEAEQDSAQDTEQDSTQEAEREGMEEQEGDSGDAVTDDTEAEETDEGLDETEKRQTED